MCLSVKCRVRVRVCCFFGVLVFCMRVCLCELCRAARPLRMRWSVPARQGPQSPVLSVVYSLVSRIMSRIRDQSLRSATYARIRGLSVNVNKRRCDEG